MLALPRYGLPEQIPGIGVPIPPIESLSQIAESMTPTPLEVFSPLRFGIEVPRLPTVEILFRLLVPKAREMELKLGELVELCEGLFIRRTPDGKIEFFELVE